MVNIEQSPSLKQDAFVAGWCITRTTINIDDQLLARLKKRTAETDSTVSKLVEEAIIVMLDSKFPATDERFELVTFGAGGQFSQHNIDKTSFLLAAEDLEKYGHGED
jgi:hypothetical protein